MLRRAEWSILVLFIMLAVSTTVWAMLGDGGALAQVGAVVSWFSVIAMFFGLVFMGIFRAGAESGKKEYQQGMQDGQRGMIEMGYILADLNKQNAMATRQGLINDGHMTKGFMSAFGQATKMILGLVDDVAEVKAAAQAAQQPQAEWWEVGPGVYASDPGQTGVDAQPDGWDSWDPYAQDRGRR